MNGKTKRINGVDLSASCFAHVGDEQDTSSWLLPMFIPGNSKKTLNALKTSLYRFDTAKIPYNERERVWFTLYGAAKVRGLDVERRTFAASNVALAQTAAPTPPVQVKVQKPVEKDPEIEAVIADADRRATELLRSLGLE